MNLYNKKINKISIIVLHLGFGGVENSICSLANMLCDYYNIEIINRLINKNTHAVRKLAAFLMD